MKDTVLRLGLLFCLLFIAFPSFSQQVSLEEARIEIKKRGLDEQQVINALKEKGIDLEKLDPNNPAELSRAETALREVLAELESKKKLAGSASGIDSTQITLEEFNAEEKKEAIKSTDEIQEAIEDGATLEEAITETIDESIKEDLEPSSIYGHNIFRDKTLKVYKQSDNIKPPSSYVLGPGDNILINIWGISEVSESFEISADGYIKPNRQPRVYLAGLTIANAKDKLKSYYGRYTRFNPDQFDVTLRTARTINVNIVGEVEIPGSFTISAVNTAFNALVAAGGPTDIGTVRNIQIVSGSEVKELDVYEFLNNPAIAQDLYLQDNDYINVRVADKIVSITGGVRKPGRYELKANESLKDLIGFAGNLTDRALSKNLCLLYTSPSPRD